MSSTIRNRLLDAQLKIAGQVAEEYADKLPLGSTSEAELRNAETRAKRVFCDLVSVEIYNDDSNAAKLLNSRLQESLRSATFPTPTYFNTVPTHVPIVGAVIGSGAGLLIGVLISRSIFGSVDWGMSLAGTTIGSGVFCSVAFHVAQDSQLRDGIISVLETLLGLEVSILFTKWVIRRYLEASTLNFSGLIQSIYQQAKPDPTANVTMAAIRTVVCAFSIWTLGLLFVHRQFDKEKLRESVKAVALSLIIGIAEFVDDSIEANKMLSGTLLSDNTIAAIESTLRRMESNENLPESVSNAIAGVRQNIGLSQSVEIPEEFTWSDADDVRWSKVGLLEAGQIAKVIDFPVVVNGRITKRGFVERKREATIFSRESALLGNSRVSDVNTLELSSPAGEPAEVKQRVHEEKTTCSDGAMYPAPVGDTDRIASPVYATERSNEKTFRWKERDIELYDCHGHVMVGDHVEVLEEARFHYGKLLKRGAVQPSRRLEAENQRD